MNLLSLMMAVKFYFLVKYSNALNVDDTIESEATSNSSEAKLIFANVVSI